MNKSTLNENEQISSQHEDIDSKLFYFLMRRIRVEEKNLGTDWLGDKPLRVTEYRFEGLPGYGFNSFGSKKDVENKIIEMLHENDITEYVYNMNERDPERIKIVKTIRKFLNFMLSDRK